MRMYEWSKDMIRFMHDASENSNYFSILASILSKYLQTITNICDAGCGLGSLSKELAKKGFQVTAADISPNAIAYVKEQAYSSVTPLLCNLKEFTPPTSFEAIIFNYFGNLDRIIEIGKRCCNGKILIIQKDYKLHRFSFSDNPIEGSFSASTGQKLKSLGIPFIEESIKLEFGQPFHSLEDALLFFEIYSKDKDRSLVNMENVKARLQKAENPNFEFYLPQPKASRLFVIHTESLK